MFYFGVGGHNYFFYSDGIMARDVDLLFDTPQGWELFHAESDGRVVYCNAATAMAAAGATQVGKDHYIICAAYNGG